MPSRPPMTEAEAAAAVARLSSLRQHQHRGKRSPHKPLLVLLALGRLAATDSSAVPWSAAESTLADLIAEFGPPTRTGRAQSAAYPFTRLRADGVWLLDAEVANDAVRPLADGQVTGRLELSVEAALRSRPDLLRAAARDLVLSNFPETVAPDVLEAVGLSADEVLGTGLSDPEISAGAAGVRRRSAGWRAAVLLAWDRQCAFCGYDGQFRGASVGVEAAHVRWFAFGGPDSLDNGLALCALHHKLFDLGALGLNDDWRIVVSADFTARTAGGRAVYELHGRRLTARPGTALPAARHVTWHAGQVFKGRPLAA